MSRTELEAAAAERYPQPKKVVGASSLGEVTYMIGPVPRSERAAYIQGRLDQAEADARIAEQVHAYRGSVEQWAAREIAASIRKGSSDEQGTAGR